MTERPVVVITGGARGIGAATAALAAERGYAVVVNFLSNESAARRVCDAITGEGGDAVAIQGDVSAEEDVARLFSEVDRRFGRLDALVNNAGIVDRQGRVVDLTAARLNRMFATT